MSGRFDDAVAGWRGTLPELRTTIRLANGPGGAAGSGPAGGIAGRDALDYGALFDDAPDSPPDVPVTVDELAFVLPTFPRGGTNVLPPGLDVDGLLEAVAKERVTATAVVPTVIYLLLDHPRLAEADLGSLRTMIYAGSPMAPERLRQALRRFGPIFVQTYAGSEPGFLTLGVGAEVRRVRRPAAVEPVGQGRQEGVARSLLGRPGALDRLSGAQSRPRSSAFFVVNSSSERIPR